MFAINFEMLGKQPKSATMTETCDSGATTDATEIPWAWLKAARYIIDNPTPPVPPLPVEIQPWLFLSDEYTTRDLSMLRRLGVTHVLSVNSMSKRLVQHLSDRFRSVGIVHKYCPGEDEEDYDMLGLHWDECRDFLRHVRDGTDGAGVVVVHCQAGINRSGLIVAAAMMVLERVPLLRVVQHCVNQRGCFLWNRSFQRQLGLLAAREGLLGEKPAGFSDDPIEPIALSPPPSGPLARITRRM